MIDSYYNKKNESINLMTITASHPLRICIAEKFDRNILWTKRIHYWALKVR